MLISQKFNTLNDIDHEFIPSLELLLGNHIPHINTLKDYESSAPKDISFAYYLFFGNKTNSPIGFAQLEFKEIKKKKKSIFSKFLKKSLFDDDRYKSDVKWTICGSDQEGILFDPRYVSATKEGANKILKELQKRDDINSQSIFFSDAHAKIIDLQQFGKPVEFIMSDTLIKNQSTYQDFFESLPNKLKDNIKANWIKVQKELGLKIGDYSSFKHAFQYKESGPTQYKSLKNHEKIKRYLKEDSPIFFQTLESKQEIKLLVIFIGGFNGSSFYDVIYQAEEISSIMIHQLALMKFYDCEEFNKLHFLGNPTQLDHLIDIGFTTKKISHIKINRG